MNDNLIFNKNNDIWISTPEDGLINLSNIGHIKKRVVYRSGGANEHYLSLSQKNGTTGWSVTYQNRKELDEAYNKISNLLNIIEI